MPARRNKWIGWCTTLRRLGVACLFSSVGIWGSALCEPNIAYADAPALTDFGQDVVRPVLESNVSANRDSAHALFVTWYPDGHGQTEVRQVRSDAMVSFAGDHPAWKLDPGLMWFLQMPVYVKQVPQEIQSDSHHEAV